MLLLIQAALLASLANSKNNNQWPGAVWLSVYMLMGLMEKASHYAYPKALLEKQRAYGPHALLWQTRGAYVHCDASGFLQSGQMGLVRCIDARK
jgi:hypothetical protein